MSATSFTSEGVGAAMPPRENIVRAILPGVELREAEGEDSGPVLAGHFARFNEWTEIDSIWEGRFMERIAPGAFKKTFRETTPKVLFDHGHDPSIGNKPLGPIRSLAEDGEGAAYEVDLLDTSYVRDLIPGLKAGLYGASFRFRVMRELMEDEPGVSEYNPQGLPERTIQEARVMEFGPVTFPAYKGATAGVRSLTDEHIMRSLLEQPDKLRALLTELLPVRDEQEDEESDPPEDNSAEPEAHPVTPRRVSSHLFGMPKKGNPTWHL